MVVAARADLLFTICGQLRTYGAEWAALGVDSVGGWKTPDDPLDKKSGPRVSSEIQGGPSGWNMPTRAIVLRKAGGPSIGDDYTMGLKTSRIDAFAYGATGKEADDVWALLDAILVPTDGRAAGFILNGIAVSDIRPAVDALAQTEPDTGWRRVWASYFVDWVTMP